MIVSGPEKWFNTIKHLAHKPGDLSFNFQMYIKVERDQMPQSCPLIPTVTVCMSVPHITHTHTINHNNK